MEKPSLVSANSLDDFRFDRKHQRLQYSIIESMVLKKTYNFSNISCLKRILDTEQLKIESLYCVNYPNMFSLTPSLHKFLSRHSNFYRMILPIQTKLLQVSFYNQAPKGNHCLPCFCYNHHLDWVWLQYSHN